MIQTPPSSVLCSHAPSYTDRVIMELIETERNYVRDLEDIIKGYLKHMRSLAAKNGTDQPNNHNNNNNCNYNNNHSCTNANNHNHNHNNLNNCSSSGNKSSCPCARLTSDQVEEFFGNIEDVYNFSSSFLNQLESCGLDPVAIARCFVQRSSGFEVYAHYCTIQYPKMLCLLMKMMSTKETADLLKERQVALNHSLPLSSYLLKPVQRILKYPLLLQSMAKHADSEKEGSNEIQEALTVVINYAFYINDKKRELEQHEQVRVQEMRRNLAIKRKKKELRKKIQVPLKKAIQCLLHLISCTSPRITAEISGM